MKCKKKKWCFILFSALCLMLTSILNNAVQGKEPVEFTQGKYKYEILTKSTVKITGYQFPSYPNEYLVDRVDIPAHVTYKNQQYAIKSIGSYAFGVGENTEGTKSFVISEGIETIEPFAFAGNPYLEEVIIPSSVKNIGGTVFDRCGSIRNLIVAENNNVYKSVENEILSKDEKILYHAFIKDQYGSYTVKDGVKVIAPYAFLGNTNVVKVILPASVETIKTKAFKDIGAYMVGGPTAEEVKIYIPDTVKKVEEGAFEGAWINVTLPNTMKNIPKGWFARASIEKIVIPDSVSVIRERAFYAASIKNIVVSKNITTIEKQAFGSIRPDRMLKMNLKLSGTNGKLKYTNGVLYSKSGKTIVKAIQPTANYKMPKSVRIIRPYAFEETAVKSIIIPKGVKVLPEGIFTKCKSLIKLDLPTTMTSIRKDAWKGSQLKTLTIRSNKVPKIYGKQQKVTTVNVKKGRISAYKKGLKNKIAYSKLR